jgi:prepilin-type N-terminal cleavage/methylation domain-containing protein
MTPSTPQTQSSLAGFTFIEVMIVMTIVGLLGVIALPSYTNYVARGHRTAARVQLLQAAMYMQRFYAANDRYDRDRTGGQTIWAVTGMYSITVVLPRIQQEFGVARGDASLPYTLTMIGFGIGGILMGRLADRFGVMAPVMLGAWAWASASPSGLAPSLAGSAWRKACWSACWAPRPPSRRWWPTPRSGSTAAAASRWRSA